MQNTWGIRNSKYHSYLQTYIASSRSSFIILLLSFDCSRRPPERTWVDAIRIQLDLLIVKIRCSCHHFGYPIEIAYVLPGLFDYLGIVIVTRSLMYGDLIWFMRGGDTTSMFLGFNLRTESQI